MDLAKKLKEAREKAGYSQQEVAGKLNISRQSISRWENGWSCPDVENLILLCQLYKISMDDLVDNKNQKSILEDKSQQFDCLFIVAIALLSCTAPIIGLFLSIGILIYCYVKKVRMKTIYWIILISCIVINISNAYAVLAVQVLDLGQGSFEKIK